VSCITYSSAGAAEGQGKDIRCRVGDGNWFDVVQAGMTGGDQVMPSACFVGDYLLVAWLDYDGGVKARFFNRAGEPRSNQFALVTEPGEIRNFQLQCDPNGVIAVAMNEKTEKTTAYRLNLVNDNGSPALELAGDGLDLSRGSYNIASALANDRVLTAGIAWPAGDTQLISFDASDLSHVKTWVDGDMKDIGNMYLVGWVNGYVGLVVMSSDKIQYVMEGVNCDSGWVSERAGICTGYDYIQ